ncbi:uncharacterized protein LOC142785868 isoform X2 [Rhipicephalus microplus]|uniref:uncharacterized protein LOC142785868 isoform X2 n=1 Tax=Rhipicephalus microplus TaxID=6941 RepID=UPI003F6BDCB8
MKRRQVSKNAFPVQRRACVPLQLRSNNGEEVMEGANNSSDCPPKATLQTYAMLPNGSRVMVTIGAYTTCFCNKSDGTNWTAQNGQPCLTLALGYNDEWTRKDGTCKNGTCMLTKVVRGCAKSSKPVTQISHPSVGCAYTCETENHSKEYAYYVVGTNCTHLGPKGLSRINTTCKQHGEKVLCRENVSLAPAC